MAKRRIRIEIRGTVQGVGFRPFVYKLATSLGLGGLVTNTRSCVIVEAEAEGEALEKFLIMLKNQIPNAARIDSMDVEEIEVLDSPDFAIIESLDKFGTAENITPDLVVCPDCLCEIENPSDRRFQYPFNNCTQCGPRFTIIRSMPYDRKNTTMSEFEMCDECAAEYSDVLGRRYHAQPVSCKKCGPELAFEGVSENALANARTSLLAGEILAIKGLGGFHLACDAHNAQAVLRLRQRKHRDTKPFALMVKDLDAARLLCEVDETEAELLESAAAPIVLLNKRFDESGGNSIFEGDSIVENPRLGIMLAYTPLHRLLFQDGITALIMTSGNLSSEPVCFTDAEAVSKLSGIADKFLTHNREIHFRNDDSVFTTFNGRPYAIRRSRGFVPLGFPCTNKRQVLAYGPGLKNTFAISKAGNIFQSHHIGDLENFEAIEGLESGIAHFEKIFEFAPEIITCDMHPGYFSSKIARARASVLGIECVEVQHHHAHMVSCMSENGLIASSEEVLGLILDGTGYGTDGTIWGGELLLGNALSFKRIGCIKPVPLLGGDLAVKEPWRNALSWIMEIYPETEAVSVIENLIIEGILPAESRTLHKFAQTQKNHLMTSSAGRMFDACSALLGIRAVNTHDAQAAMELEWLAKRSKRSNGVRPHLTFLPEINNKAELALEFHEKFAESMAKLCRTSSKGIQKIVLSGGVFQNLLLLDMLKKLLEDSGFEVYTHSLIPCNDGGISVGQCEVAGARKS